MGGGGDGGAGERQAAIEEAKRRSRNSVNALFGTDPAHMSAPTMSGRQEVLGRLGGNAGRAIAAAEMAPVEALFRQQQQDAATNRDARNALYDTVRTNAFDAGRRDIDERAADAARQLRFSLLDAGLGGSSIDVDENARLQRVRDQGIVDLGARADAARTDLESNDEEARLGLLQSIDAGMDQGSAIGSAINQMRVNADRAAASAQGTSVGDLFSGAGLLYDRRRRDLGQQEARRQFGQAAGGGRDYTGTVSGTGG